MLCKYCKNDTLVVVEANEPYHPEYLQCEVCDSTFVIEDRNLICLRTDHTLSEEI